MSLQNHVAASADPRKATRAALLTAITEGVDEVKKEGGTLDYKLDRLKTLAETYALVVHGSSD
ncbi:hypothetical protein PV350_04865 [Streptomyces sp. PA03-6a]|nr:hypothetical protein [Streptomyces sp. PA03-6a]